MTDSKNGRFAPSPTGTLHLGNLRTALLAWLFARSVGARFELRIEDLDPQRSRLRHEARQRVDLEAIGIDWDSEAPRQSSRAGRYREAVDKLVADGRTYECWCSRTDVRTAAEAPHGMLPAGFYPGTCRELTMAQRATRERAAGRPPVLRLDARAETVGFEDALHGHFESVVDDLVLWRSDGVAAYNLAVVVDDCDRGIREVVRGDDLLEATPRQLMLARLLGLREPTYAHVPLVLGADGRRLSKRHGSVTLGDRARLGESAAEAVGWMARSLGLAQRGEAVSAGDLVDRLSPSRLPRQATVFEAA